MNYLLACIVDRTARAWVAIHIGPGVAIRQLSITHDIFKVLGTIRHRKSRIEFLTTATGSGRPGVVVERICLSLSSLSAGMFGSTLRLGKV